MPRESLRETRLRVLISTNKKKLSTIESVITQLRHWFSTDSRRRDSLERVCARNDRRWKKMTVYTLCDVEYSRFNCFFKSKAACELSVIVSLWVWGIEKKGKIAYAQIIFIYIEFCLKKRELDWLTVSRTTQTTVQKEKYVSTLWNCIQNEIFSNFIKIIEILHTNKPDNAPFVHTSLRLAKKRSTLAPNVTYSNTL